MINITLPFPISVNALYRNVRGVGRVKTERYRTWIQAAGWDVKQAKQKPINGWYRISMTLHESENRRRDIDNFFKGVSDLLVAHKLIDDDCFCTDIVITRVRSDVKKCVVTIAPSTGIPDERLNRIQELVE